ncbi:hypothetical protein ACFQ3P_10675 [Paraburkholderia sabiae]|uniref:hypothetical protein n=1 Tax=Paraburkholderia sabiae TaxID=273251 RepID=UPI0025B744D9|nr:hypothetical protein [Paraburkholderia sabiae]WJZ74087.1 hypothetical protein QEN71_28865 [Paraburkholderia sabiae]
MYNGLVGGTLRAGMWVFCRCGAGYAGLASCFCVVVFAFAFLFFAFAGIRDFVAVLQALPLCGAAPTFLCSGKEK